MRIATVALIPLALGLAAPAGWGAAKPAAKQATATHATAKPAPACAALVFRALPAAAPDGEQTAGMYKSRLARLELRATVQNGAAANYYIVAGGNRLAAAPQALPEAAANCTAAKQMPKPQAAGAACTGERFTVVVSHAGQQRFALLYGLNGGVWAFCNAGTF